RQETFEWVAHFFPLMSSTSSRTPRTNPLSRIRAIAASALHSSICTAYSYIGDGPFTTPTSNSNARVETMTAPASAGSQTWSRRVRQITPLVFTRTVCAERDLRRDVVAD